MGRNRGCLAAVVIALAGLIVVVAVVVAVTLGSGRGNPGVIGHTTPPVSGAPSSVGYRPASFHA
jgi:hypothetical protein